MVGLFGRFGIGGGDGSGSGSGGGPKKRENAQEVKELRRLVRAKKYPEALRVGTRYLQNVPENHDVQFIVGSIHYLQGRHKTAISFFENALKIGSYDVDVLVLKANSHHILGQDRRAVQCCDRIREIDPKNKAASELLSKIDPGG